MASLLAGSSVVEVSGTDKNETGNWSEESDGVYTSTRTAKIAGDRHYATLKLSTWSSAQQSDAYAIRESGAVLAYSSIVTDKTAYTAGGAIKVTVTLKDSYENLVGGNETLSTRLSSCQIQKRKASPGMKIKKEFIPQRIPPYSWHRFKSTATDVRLGERSDFK